MHPAAALAALDWQIELGADEAIGDSPVNRYEAKPAPRVRPSLKTGPKSNIAPIDVMPAMPQVQESAPDIARILAARCADLNALRDALAVFDHCALKQGARNLVFGDGHPAARVMVITDAPGNEEDRAGKPFIGPTGELLNNMFKAINLSRSATDATALYVAPVMPWRSPLNQDPAANDIAMMLPFLERHVALVNPDFVVCMGNTACNAVLGRVGINRFRGKWATAFDKPVLPMLHPLALLKDPLKKRDTWADLLDLKSRLDQ